MLLGRRRAVRPGGPARRGSSARSRPPRCASGCSTWPTPARRHDATRRTAAAARRRLRAVRRGAAGLDADGVRRRWPTAGPPARFGLPRATSVDPSRIWSSPTGPWTCARAIDRGAREAGEAEHLPDVELAPSSRRAHHASTSTSARCTVDGVSAGDRPLVRGHHPRTASSRKSSSAPPGAGDGLRGAPVVERGAGDHQRGAPVDHRGAGDHQRGAPVHQRGARDDERGAPRRRTRSCTPSTTSSRTVPSRSTA